MPKSVHMHVKNFTCIASIMHVKFEVHMHDKIVSHVWKDFTCNKMHGKIVQTYDKNFSHVLQNFTCTSKSSHACEMLMWWTCIFPNIDFTWFLFFTHFSHPFHTIFTHIALVVKRAFEKCKPWGLFSEFYGSQFALRISEKKMASKAIWSVFWL